MIEIVNALIVVLLVYWVAPTLIAFYRFRKRNRYKMLAFTFDDGPDPVYTPQLLDLLKEYKIKATFFVLGSKAYLNSQLVLRMHQEGHQIGIHNYEHRSNWLMSPYKVREQLHVSADIVEQITGVRPVCYRPPWGLLTLFDLFLLKDFHIVLWTIMAWDWWEKGGIEKIKRKLLQWMQKGGVVLLHDSGQTFGASQGAPQLTIQAISEMFSEGLFDEYACKRVDECAIGEKNESLQITN